MKSKSKIITIIFVILVNYINAQQLIDPSLGQSCEIANMSEINTPQFEFSPCFYGDGIAFVYSLKKEKKSIFDKSINTSFFDLGFYFPDNSTFPFDSTQKMYRFAEELNSDYHEGPLCFHEDKICYYTREDADYKKSRKRKGKSVLQILKSRNHRNVWSESKVLSFCDKKYNYCHPTLSEDGETMIFASDQPGGHGKMDLYLTTKDERGRWEEPYNLGSNINSSQNEWFPFYFRDSLLFFASDKPGGLGGLDIYVSNLIHRNFSEPELLPEPLNGTQDDFGFILRNDGTDGYFSSARSGGKGNDDIYRFQNKTSILFQDSKVEFMFTLMDSISNTELKGVSMKYIAIKTEERIFAIDDYHINLLKSSNEGSFLLELSPKGDAKGDVITSNDFGKLWGILDRSTPYVLSFQKEGYEDYMMVFDADKIEANKLINMKKSQKVFKPIEASNYFPETPRSNSSEVYIPLTSGSKIIFNNIYYDSNKSNIQQGAADELNALATVMLQNNDMKIILNSHTDAVGKSSYNLVLSQKRADSAKNYLVAKGVQEDRIIAIGLGETEIINHCTNNVNCSEEEHKINRRTEVEVL